MAVNIYTELAALAARIAKLEALHAPKARVAPVTYFRGTAQWDAVLAAKPALAMINPGSGPGPRADSLYVGLVPKCKAAGIPVFGYVYTDYGRRPAAAVKADIDNHIAWYGIDGIFLDEGSAQLADLPYYKDLHAYLKARGKLVALNPGYKTAEEYMTCADYIMVAEVDAATYRTQTRNAWEMKYPGRLWHCVHTCSEAEMPGIVDLAKRNGAGLIYVTGDVMANPYDTLPTYWSALLEEVTRAP